MSEYENLSAHTSFTTRRQLITAAAVAFGGLAAGAKVWGQTPPQSMQEVPSTAANAARTSLHQEVAIKAEPRRIYEAILDSKQFAAFSGLAADIDRNPGGAFTMFGGLIAGRNVELTPNACIVQAWRPSHWEPSVYSIVRFDFKAQDGGTLVVLDHKGFPAGDYDSLYAGWTGHYFDPLKKFLA
jgi:activator of HSP90 ATPase